MQTTYRLRWMRFLYIVYAVLFLFAPWNRGLFFFENMIVYDVILLVWAVVSFLYLVVVTHTDASFIADEQRKKDKKRSSSGSQKYIYVDPSRVQARLNVDRWCLLSQRLGLSGSYTTAIMTWSLLLLSIWYVVRAPFGVQASNAWDQAYRIAAVILSFIILAALFRTEHAYRGMAKERLEYDLTGERIVGLSVFGTLTWTSLLAVLAALGIVDYQDAVLSNNRLSSVYQYPNTYGVIVGMLIILTLFWLTGVERFKGEKEESLAGVDQAMEADRSKERVKKGTLKERSWFWLVFQFLLAGIFPLLWVVFIYSFSRGAWIFLPVFWWIGLLAFSWRYQIRYIALTLGGILFALPLTIAFNQWLLDKSPLGIVWMLGAAVVFASLVVGLKMYFLKRMLKLKDGISDTTRHLSVEGAGWKATLSRMLLPLSLIILGGFGITMVRSKAVLSLLPSEVAARLQDISLTTQNTIERFNFYKDSLKLMRDYPLFGAGGDAWRDVFLHYQSYPYFSTQTHSFIFQLALETGLVGLVLFVLALAMLIIRIMVVLRKLDASGRMHLVAYTLVMFYLFAHAQIDFDFSYGFILLLFWTLWALVEAYMLSVKEPDRNRNEAAEKKDAQDADLKDARKHRSFWLRPEVYARGSMVLLAVWMTFTLILTARDAYAYNLPVERVNLTTLERNLLQKKAIRSQDRSVHILALQAYEQLYQQTKEARWLEYAKEEARHLERVSPLDPRVLMTVSRFWATIGDGARAQEVADAALKTAPWYMPAVDWMAELTGKELLQSAQSVSSWSDPAFQSQLQKARETFSVLQKRFEAQRAFLDAEPPVSQYPYYQLSAQFLLYEGFVNVLASQRGSDAEKQALSEMWAHIAAEKNTATLKELYAFMISLSMLNGYTEEAERMRSDLEANVPKEALQGLEDSIRKWQLWLKSKP